MEFRGEPEKSRRKPWGMRPKRFKNAFFMYFIFSCFPVKKFHDSMKNTTVMDRYTLASKGNEVAQIRTFPNGVWERGNTASSPRGSS
jgi:hypothetical protein